MRRTVLAGVLILVLPLLTSCAGGVGDRLAGLGMSSEQRALRERLKTEGDPEAREEIQRQIAELDEMFPCGDAVSSAAAGFESGGGAGGGGGGGGGDG